jgi:hypothetical protein
MNDGIPFVTMANWGKDHWSTLAYAETRCMDYGGRLDHRHMRCNEQRHPTKRHMSTPHDPTKHFTRLFGYFANKEAPSLRVEGHDDWDCLLDAENEGLVEINMNTGHVTFTRKGNKVAAALRDYKKQPGNPPYALFQWGN